MRECVEGLARSGAEGGSGLAEGLGHGPGSCKGLNMLGVTRGAPSSVFSSAHERLPQSSVKVLFILGGTTPSSPGCGNRLSCCRIVSVNVGCHGVSPEDGVQLAAGSRQGSQGFM